MDIFSDKATRICPIHGKPVVIEERRDESKLFMCERCAATGHEVNILPREATPCPTPKSKSS